MASIRQIKYSKDFDIEDIDIKELETQETRENIADNFDREQAQSIFDVYNKIKGDSTKEAKFKELYALMSDMNSAEWAYDGKENKTLLNEKDGVQTLRIKNLGGSGLDLAITDDKSFIFEQGGLTDWQVASFASFFADHGMTPESFEGVKDLKVTNAKGEEIGTFEQVYASYTDYSQYEGKSAEELSKLLESKEGYAEYMAAIDRRGAIKAHGNLTPELQAELETLNRQIATFEPALVRAQEQQQSQLEEWDNVHASGNHQQEDDSQSQSQQQSSPQAANDDNKDYELPKGNEDDLGGYDNVSFNSYIEGAEKDKKPSLRTFKATAGIRGGIMRVDKKCIRQRRMPDGSYVISFYNSEEDKLKDGKVDPKTGIAKHTKRCALRYYPGKPPTIGVYIPQSSKVEGGVAKGALGSLKNMGYKYFTMPPSFEFGGEVFGAFMSAAGDQLMCPRLKRSADDTEGCDMGNDNLNQILKAIKDKDDGSNKELKLFKMRLVEEINAYHEYKEKSGQKDKISTKLADSAAMLAGDVKFDHWASSTLPKLNLYIKNGTEQGWNAVDVACAYAAQAKVAEAIHKGELTYADENGQEHRVKYDYLEPDKQDGIIDKMFKSEMRKAEPNVIAYFKENCHAGSSEPEYDDEGNQLDQYPDKDNGKLQQRHFDNASRKLVDHFRDDVAGRTFTTICGKYSGSEKAKDWRPEKTTGYRNIRIGKEDEFANLHGNRRRQQNNGQQRPQSTR